MYLYKFFRLFEKLALITITFLLVLFFTLMLYDWGEKQKTYLLRTKNIESYIMLFVLVFIVAYFLRKILAWEMKIQLHPKKALKKPKKPSLKQ